MNDPVMFVLGLLALGVLVLFLVDDSDPKMDATPVETTTVIPDPFAPREPKHRDDYRATDTPYMAMRFFDPANYGERTTAKVQRQADAFEFVQNWKG